MGFVWIPGLSPSLREATTGTQGRSLESGAEAESVAMLTYWLAHTACSACSLGQPRLTCAGVAPPTVGYGPLASIANQENAPQTCMQGNLMEGTRHLRQLLPR